jgi:hypothetical protein
MFSPGIVIIGENRGVRKNSRSSFSIYSEKLGESQLRTPDLATLICLGAVLLLAVTISIQVTWAYIKQQQVKNPHKKHARFKKNLPSTHLIKTSFKNRLKGYRP